VRDISGRNFGLLIAYLLPGFMMVLAVATVSPPVRRWLAAVSAQPAGATVGGFLYLTLACVAAGMATATVRWAVIDKLHQRTGITRPDWDESGLQEKLDAFDRVVSDHWRYHEHLGGMLVALICLAAARWLSPSSRPDGIELLDAGIACFCVLYWMGSRDTLRRYYRRANAIMGSRNGNEVNDERKWTPRHGGHRNGAEEARSPGDQEPQGRTPAEAGSGPAVRCIAEPGLVIEVGDCRIKIGRTGWD
jgi:hypothetical protein